MASTDYAGISNHRFPGTRNLRMSNRNAASSPDRRHDAWKYLTGGDESIGTDAALDAAREMSLTSQTRCLRSMLAANPCVPPRPFACIPNCSMRLSRSGYQASFSAILFSTLLSLLRRPLTTRCLCCRLLCNSLDHDRLSF